MDERYARAYLSYYSEEVQELEASFFSEEQTPENRVRLMHMVADTRFEIWCVRFTAGGKIPDLREEFGIVVDGYLLAAQHEREIENEPALPWFDFKHLDDYQRLLSLLSLAILLHREDLIPAVHSLFKGGEPDEEDALEEDLLGKYVPGRPILDVWYHDMPYRHLLDVTAQTPANEKLEDLKKYLKAWYKGMAPTGWYDSHKNQTRKGGGDTSATGPSRPRRSRIFMTSMTPPLSTWCIRKI
ncbi:DUF1911 domain-containing protein [Aquabacterium sp. A7-Y]|nr:PoNe immunity protein domain-containing protein [Aquabacterium sp. A7-Y]MCW7538032.1 DUF1911 domain-containing protein [Aquabacterium sp. A7-Y]